MLNQITKKVDVLNDDGTIKSPGYSFRYIFNYNRENIKVRESRIKEWEFYQFIENEWVMQFTIGFASIFDSYSFNLFNTTTGKKYSFGKLRRHKKNEIVYPNPEENFDIQYESNSFGIRFINKNGLRTISFHCTSRKYGQVKALITINGDINNEKMCILTPFKENKEFFYLNYKENYYDCRGEVQIGLTSFVFEKLKGLVDSGRGYWPFKQNWVWSSLASSINGHDIGWNLGYGFGDLSYATENMIFFDHKGYQLGELEFDIDYENQATNKVKIRDKAGIFNAELEPYFDNFTRTDFIWIHNKCHQVFYKAKGTIVIEGKDYSFFEIPCFLEHAENQW